MRCASWVVATGVVATVAACSLTTSLSGLSSGGAADAPDAGDASTPLDAGSDGSGPTGSDGGPDSGRADSAYRAAVLADGPLAYFRLDDQDTIARDEVGAHDGAYKGSVTHGAAGAIAGDPNRAATFDGTSGYVEVGDVLPFLMTSPFTIEAWVSPTSGATDPACIASKSFAQGGLSGGLTDGWTFYLDSGSNAINVARYLNGSDDTETGGAAPLGTYAHVVASYDGATLTVWLNGVAMGSKPSSRQLVSHAKPLTIGASRGGIYCFFRGSLDEVALYGTALPMARIRAHYLAGGGK